MLSEYLQSALVQNFPNRSFIFGVHPESTVEIEGPCNAISPISISDDGDELTIYFGQITHVHYGCYDDALTPDEKERKIVSDVIELLQNLFSDRIVVSRYFNGLAAGIKNLKPNEFASGDSLISQRFVWSGPIKK